MKKLSFLAAIMFVLCVTAGPSNPQYAPTPQLVTPRCTVLKSWGRVAGVTTEAVLFEDTAGTIRVVQFSECMAGRVHAMVEIRRQ
jgi:hypothetical protein